MKIKNLIIATIAMFALTSCAKESTYEPKKGGLVDTLHNEVHVTNLEALNKGGFDYEKDPAKVYITDDDNFTYIYDIELGEYVLSQETDTTINFYFDASQTTRLGYVKNEAGQMEFAQIDCPIYVADWYMIKPLGKCPDEISTQEKVLEIGKMFGFEPKNNFTHFVGFSLYSSCLGDEAHLWNFEENYKQQAVTNLYGIWVDD